MKKLITIGIVALAASTSVLASSYDALYVKLSGQGFLGAKLSSDSAVYEQFKDKQGEYSYGASLSVGYNVMENIRTELQVSYAKTPEFLRDNSSESSDDNKLGFESHGALAFVNTYVDLMSLGQYAKIYANAGLGMSYMKGEISKKDNKIETFDQEVAFAWQVGAGLSFDVAQNTDIDLGYNYVSIGGPKDESTGDSTVKWKEKISDKSLYSHSLSLGLRFSM
jgi:opacity protein-like surface antigen